MKLKRVHLLSSAAILLWLGGCLSDRAENEEDDPVVAAGELTYEEFKDSLPYDKDSQSYIIEDDTRVHDEALLHKYYDMKAEHATALAIWSDSTTHWNWGNTNVLSRYDDTRKLNLTYCVSNQFTAAERTAIRAGFATAAGNWEGNGINVNFIDSTPTGGCALGDSSVFFDIRKYDANDTDGTPVCMFAGCVSMNTFFPWEASRTNRYIWMERFAYANGVDSAQATHELGHALGFVHEHRRRPGCTAEQGRTHTNLTGYDELSVMHYFGDPAKSTCVGPATTYTISAEDVRGARCIYNEAASVSYCMRLAGTAEAQPWGSTITASGNGIYGVNASGNVVQFINYGWYKLVATDTKKFKYTIGGINKWFGVGTDDCPYQWSNSSKTWTKIGNAGSQFVVTYNDQLFALTPDKSAVWRWSGSGTTWTNSGSAFSKLIAGNKIPYALDSAGNIWRWNSGTSWTKIGSPGKKFVADGADALYAVTPDGSQVVRYTSASGWSTIGQTSQDVWSGPGVSGVYSKGSDGLVYRYKNGGWSLVTRRKASNYVLNYSTPSGFSSSPMFSLLVEQDTGNIYRYVEL